MSESIKFSNKKIYLLKRIREEFESLSSSNDSEIKYILGQAEEKFFYSAPEVVDECFYILNKFIDLDEDFDKHNFPLRSNINGQPIRCFICDRLGHVQKDCDSVK
jgi:hypothetical protein